MPWSGNEGPDQTAHSRSLIRAFISRLQCHLILMNISTNREGSGETTRMNRLILVIAVLIWHKGFVNRVKDG